jgi:peptidoglycan/xylan/chitin deacetylase (PgdA/CDA1 family)
MTQRSTGARWSRRAVLASAGAAVLAGCGRDTAPDTAAIHHEPPASSPSTTASSTTTAPVGGPARYVTHGSRAGTAVALTFHGSGDADLTRQLLSAAHQSSTPITVFGVGTWLAANPDLASIILSDGHTLGNHTYTHPDLGTLDAAAVADEIVRCATVLDGLEGDNGRWFRPSGIVVPTALILDQAGQAGYPVSVGYDVDPLDYEDPGSDAIVARVAQGLQPGSIVSLHTGHAGTVEAFPTLVQMIRSRHLEPALIGDLIAL